jgi:hypothetical protein
VLIVVVVKVVVNQGDTTMTPLSWILIAMDVHASDIDGCAGMHLARLRPSNCENTLVKGTRGCNSLCNFQQLFPLFQNVASRSDSITELRMIDVTRCRRLHLVENQIL